MTRGIFCGLRRAAFMTSSPRGRDAATFRWNWLRNDLSTSEAVVMKKGQKITGDPISRRTTATLVMNVMNHPERYIGESPGVSSIWPRSYVTASESAENEKLFCRKDAIGHAPHTIPVRVTHAARRDACRGSICLARLKQGRLLWNDFWAGVRSSAAAPRDRPRVAGPERQAKGTET